jgi:hypothetical protein
MGWPPPIDWSAEADEAPAKTMLDERTTPSNERATWFLDTLIEHLL